MPLLLLVFLALVCLPDISSYARPPWIAEPPGAGFLTLLITAAPVLAVAYFSGRVVTGLRRRPQQRDRILQDYEHARRWTNLAQFAAYAVALGVCGWGWFVGQAWRWGDWPLPLPEVLLLAPLLLSMVLCWAFWFAADAAAHRALTTDGSSPPPLFAHCSTYVLFHLRARLGLVLIPIALLVLFKELRVRMGWQEADAWFQALGLLGLLVLIPLMPLLVRLVLGLERLPDGPVRRRLETVARRLGFRYTDLLVWNTRGGMANAMVLGVLPWPRYVVFTEHLLERFRIEEIEAVFGHEIGHVKHQHMLYYLGFLAASMVVVSWAAVLLFPPSPAPAADDGFWALFHPQLLEVLPLVGCVLVYIFLVFGYLSRRCERQADIYGCRAVSRDDPHCAGHDPEALPPYPALCPTGVRIFIRALEKVAHVNGISKERPGFLQSWQHSTIARRIHFLGRMLSEPDLEPSFQRRIALVKVALIVLLATAILTLVGTQTLAR